MKVNFTLPLDTERDKAVLDQIAWLKANKRNVSAWLREMIHAGMSGQSALERQVEQQGRKLDEIHRLLKSGIMVSSGGAAVKEEGPERVSALDRLGV